MARKFMPLFYDHAFKILHSLRTMQRTRSLAALEKMMAK